MPDIEGVLVWCGQCAAWFAVGREAANDLRVDALDDYRSFCRANPGEHCRTVAAFMRRGWQPPEVRRERATFLES